MNEWSEQDTEALARLPFSDDCGFCDLAESWRERAAAEIERARARERELENENERLRNALRSLRDYAYRLGEAMNEEEGR